MTDLVQREYLAKGSAVDARFFSSFVGGTSCEELAAEVALTEAAAYQRVCRLRKALRSTLGAHAK